MIEDCAHTLGAGWNGKATGTWGRAGCFSLQSYKHANSGEGGLLATDDEDVAAQAILLSGSYMFYAPHRARPDEVVFERWKYVTPNFSLRMSNLAAALADRSSARCWPTAAGAGTSATQWLAAALAGVRQIRLPVRPAKEQFVASSIQFSLVLAERVPRQASSRAAPSAVCISSGSAPRRPPASPACGGTGAIWTPQALTQPSACWPACATCACR